MLVIVSDLHLCDGTAYPQNVTAGSFALLQGDIYQLAERYGAKQLDIVFLGDVFDLLRTEQWFAAPEGERPTFTEVFDTIVTVSKSKATKTVYIASDFPKERARLELAAINPNRKGIEGFRAELAAEALATELTIAVGAATAAE